MTRRTPQNRSLETRAHGTIQPGFLISVPLTLDATEVRRSGDITPKFAEAQGVLMWLR